MGFFSKKIEKDPIPLEGRFNVAGIKCGKSAVFSNFIQG